MRQLFSTLSLFLLIPAAQAGIVDKLVEHRLQQVPPSLKTNTVKELYFQQVLDHEQPTAGVFKQRYYIDESYSQSPDDPVFFYICGEAACESGSLNGAIRVYARQYHAKMVALEHRYYGKSIPFAKLSAENLRYLSTQAALQDLATFERQIRSEHQWTGPWVAFGGSYPGSLSAYYRMKYPYLVVGSLASSAPVQAKEDFIDYDAHVTRVAGSECANRMRDVVAAAEQALADPKQATAFKARFAAQDVKNDTDFLYLLADVGATAVQYGMRDQFCQGLTQSSSPTEAYANFAKKIYAWLGINAVEMTFEGARSEDASLYSQGVGMRQWIWQSCREYGYWQNAHPDANQSTRSSRINLDYHRQVCKRLFGLTQPADTQAINHDLYQPLLNNWTSHIFLTNGTQDPWSKLSMTVDNGNAENPMLDYQLIDQAAHCDDLRSPKGTDSASIKQARQTMARLLREWLAGN